MFRSLGTIIVTAVLVSAFWIFYQGITGSRRDGKVEPVGDKAIVQPASAPAVTVAESVTVGPAGLAIPVAGIKADQLVDTFTQARAGGARVHDAIDIMAAEGTPVVAAAPGTVEKLYFSNGGGGVSAYVRSDDGLWTYYYAHLQRYADGLAEGQKIGRGAPVGFVGHTGNASPDGPHLHFAINRMNPGEKWYQGTPINPYPLLAGTPATR
ncbi:M23 family metallopeptidase [Sphingomonas jaspsi]|uniref:M23 family metallopeptidase n=1 Tax=Sphingomonas jaspsi TaxID=392409 RepID=UPI0004B79222|nr:M23 family metallopeptidase [Sphingomonas jaspsi]